MAGNYRSGRHQERTRIENVPQINALKYAKQHGTPTRTKQTPSGEDYTVALCPACGREARFLHFLEGVTACRRCHAGKLIYSSQSQRKTAAESLRREPAQLGAALETMQSALDQRDTTRFNEAMTILSAVAQMPAELENDTPASFEAIQARVIAEDLTKCTALMQKIETMIESGEENHVNRKGEPSVVPMRVESATKLFHAFATISNVRAARAGIATQIHETRRNNADGSSLAQQIDEAFKRNNHRTPEGFTIEELQQRATGKTLPGIAADQN